MYRKNELDYQLRRYEESITQSHKLFSNEVLTKIKLPLRSYNMFYLYYNRLDSSQVTLNPDYISYDKTEINSKDKLKVKDYSIRNKQTLSEASNPAQEGPKCFQSSSIRQCPSILNTISPLVDLKVDQGLEKIKKQYAGKQATPREVSKQTQGQKK